jgi:hypothetical protein
MSSRPAWTISQDLVTKDEREREREREEYPWEQVRWGLEAEETST